MLHETASKVFSLSIKKRVSLKERLPEGCQNKLPNEKAIFFFPYLTSKYPLKEYRPLCPKSYVLCTHLSRVTECSAASERIALWPVHGHCWLYDRAKPDQTYCLELLTRMPRLHDHIVCLCSLGCHSSYHSSHLPRGNAISSPNLSSFHLIPILLLVFKKSDVPPSPFPLFPCFSASYLDRHFLKGKWSPKQH